MLPFSICVISPHTLNDTNIFRPYVNCQVILNQSVIAGTICFSRKTPAPVIEQNPVFAFILWCWMSKR